MRECNTILTMKMIYTFYLFLLPLLVSCREKQIYTVYLRRHQIEKTKQEIEAIHHSYLSSVKQTSEDAKASLIYSYNRNINGFAALLTSDEAFKLIKLENVVSVFESHTIEYSTQTTRSWKFLGLEGLEEEEIHNWNQLSDGNDLLKKAKYGKNVIVGVIDTGIWPESKSFNDEGMEPIDQHIWEEECQAGVDNNPVHCNKKIIGAKYYLNDFESHYGELNTIEDVASPRDYDGHGTHMASIIAGRTIKGVASIGGYALGTTSGGAPMARLAIYKVCWAIPKQPRNRGSDCRPADVTAGIKDAVKDGVHVLSISIGMHQSTLLYQHDATTFGALYAVKNDIVVVCAVGNSGPQLGTVRNVAPWVISVGASTIDRMFLGTLALGNGDKIMGQTITPYSLGKMHPLVYAGNVENPYVRANGKCLNGSLSDGMVKGKIVFCCNLEIGPVIEKGLEVMRAGGVGVIFGNPPDMGEEIGLDAHFLPAISLSYSNALKVINYIKSSTTNAEAKIGLGITKLHSRPAPSVSRQTGRGPNMMDLHILKPDLIAPGLNILAAWSNASSPTRLPDDHRVVDYNIISGSSVAAPHVAAVASLLRAIHPKWSHAAIKSALMTTASIENDEGKLITDYNGMIATPFALGSGHIMPTKAVDPGLIYDASYTDYFDYLCNRGEENFVRILDENFTCPKTSTPSYNLNYPSLTLLNMKGTVMVRRTVTNVGNRYSNYSFHAKPLVGISVEAHPNKLIFGDVGEKKNFTIIVTPSKRARDHYKGNHVFGEYTWSDNKDHIVRSPIVISLNEN